jgi:hypothetical protein
MVSLVAVCAAGGANEGRALSACGTSNFARGRSSIQRCTKRNDVLLRLDPEVAQKWSDLEVVRRWGRLCPIEGQSCQFRAKPCRDCDEIDRRNACLRSLELLAVWAIRNGIHEIVKAVPDGIGACRQWGESQLRPGIIPR